MNIHVDQNPGFIPGFRRWSKRTNATGETYWHVEEDIGYMPFADRPVSGTIEAFGRTQAEAEDRIREKRKKLMEAFWE